VLKYKELFSIENPAPTRIGLRKNVLLFIRCWIGWFG